jgi:hypothetical protein
MKFNMNNYVEVVLTERGAEIYNECWKSYKSLLPKKSGDVLKDPLWSIMETFGQHVGLGANSPFENCEIDLLNFGE